MQKANIRTILMNLLVFLGFVISFFAVYQAVILNNLDIFGETETGGGWISYGAQVQGRMFWWAIASIIIAFVLWRIKKLRIKLLPLLLVAVLLPIMVYRVNYRVFINGDGAAYKEKQTIVIHLKDRAKLPYDDQHIQDLKKYPIFVAEQQNEDFYTYLYINEALDDMYLFMKLSPEAKVSGEGAFICYQFMQPLDEFLAENTELDYTTCKKVNVNNYGIRDIEIYNNCAILIKDDFSKTYFVCSDYKWLLDEELSKEKLSKIVAQNLGVPNDKHITCEVSEKYFWESADRYYKNVTFYQSGEIAAFAGVDPYTGELLKNIMEYDSAN